MRKIFTSTVLFICLFTQNVFSQGWQWVDTGFPYIIYDMCFPSGQSELGYAVGATSTFGGDGIILKTTDGGSSWIKISTDTIPGLRAVCFTSADVGYVGGDQNSLMKTTDGGSSWSFILIDDKLWFFNNIEFWDDNNGVAVSYPSSVYQTTDAGANWNTCIGIKHSVEDICYADATTLFLVGGDEKIYKSTNSGFYWTEIYSGAVLQLFLGVEFFNVNYGIVAGENGNTLITSDGGTTWNTSIAGGSGLMRGIHIFDEQESYVVGTPEQVYKTTDGGINWFSDFSGGNSVALYNIIFTENNTGLICGSQGKFLRNTDYIVPVELISFNVKVDGNNVQLNWATATELNNSGFEIYKSSDNNNWKVIAFVLGYGTSSELKNYSFIDEEIKNGKYYYRLKQIDYDGKFEYSEIEEIEVLLPLVFNLEQNYPNPFNPLTTINFSLPEATNVTLTIYNTLGQKIDEIVNTYLEAGLHSFQWDANNSTSGLYFYELRTERYESVKKMLLMK